MVCVCGLDDPNPRVSRPLLTISNPYPGAASRRRSRHGLLLSARQIFPLVGGTGVPGQRCPPVTGDTLSAGAAFTVCPDFQCFTKAFRSLFVNRAGDALWVMSEVMSPRPAVTDSLSARGIGEVAALTGVTGRGRAGRSWCWPWRCLTDI